MNAEEQSENERAVVNTRDALREVSITQTVKAKDVERTYNFDQVFGAHATQEDIYDDAVRPVVEEVLEGFNCTIFAYGQTGTGKTHTMEGYHDWDDASSSESSSSFADAMPSNAGVIPRAMSHIFAHLKAKGVEHSVKCTFLELYNEEITDLLAVSDLVEGSVEFANAKAPKHPLMEDGKGGVAVKGLEEVSVPNPETIFEHIRRGSAKRRTAETLMNKQSSRSHSVFSVTVHTKESTPDGEDVIRCGKLNLVDLAGSENISRSGAVDKRAREAGEINKSLLTLGRVIAALVAGVRSFLILVWAIRVTDVTCVLCTGWTRAVPGLKAHPLLRDALGGKSKTCIIATVSPAAHSAEETLQTLEYAHRAKSIKNKPEINARVTKNALLKDLQKEVERLTADLTATREKNGVYLSQQSYDTQEEERAQLKLRADTQKSALDLAKSELASLAALFEDQKKAHKALQREHAHHAEKMSMADAEIQRTKAELSKEHDARVESEYLADEFERAQERLRVKTGALGETLHGAKDEMRLLFGKIDRVVDIDVANRSVLEAVKSDVVARLERLEASLAEVKTAEESARAAAASAIAELEGARVKERDALVGQIQKMRTDAKAATSKAAVAARAAATSAKAAADAALAAAETAAAAGADCDLTGETVDAQIVSLLSAMDAGRDAECARFKSLAETDAARSARAVELANAQATAAREAAVAMAGAVEEMAAYEVTGGTPVIKTAATMLATPVRSRDVDEMVQEREATLAAFRARVAAGEASGGAAESTPVKDADADEDEEEEASSSADEATDETDEEQAETPTPEVVEEVKPKRGGRAASTRGTRGVKTSGIPRAPLVDKKNAQDA
jgi:kinesin family protein 11